MTSLNDLLSEGPITRCQTCLSCSEATLKMIQDYLDLRAAGKTSITFALFHRRMKAKELYDLKLDALRAHVNNCLERNHDGTPRR